MKKLICTLVILSSLLVNAQTSGEIQSDFFKHLKSDAIILTDSGLIRDSLKVKKYAAKFKGSTYKNDFSIHVRSTLDFEIGELKIKSDIYTVMFLKTKDVNANATVEFLTIYKKSKSGSDYSEIDTAREKWMKLCNSHQASKLVEQLYESNAYYYNKGRVLQGSEALAAEYSYMNSSSYSLTLTPKHIVSVTPDIVYEIGQCSGSYPLPYMLLWKKQKDGTWKILMDSNY